MNKEEIISAFAYFTGKEIERIINETTDNLKETNMYLEAKLLDFLSKIDKFEIGNAYKEYVKNAYMSHFNITSDKLKNI
jgi:hypothetical protein